MGRARRLRRRHPRLRDRRHAGGLRAPGQAGARRGLRGRGVVSGINHGANLGDDITYSGTVAAALEGVLLGLPAIAVSQQSADREMDFRLGREFDFHGGRARSPRSVVERLDEVPLPPGTLLNVNVPGGDPRASR